MSIKYKRPIDVPTTTLIDRLKELAIAVTTSRDAILREFYMSVPAQLDNDADLVINEAANRLSEFDNMKVIKEIVGERKRQDKKWGGPEHDDQHEIYQFARFIKERCLEMELVGNDDRKDLIEIGALAIAGIESFDRKETLRKARLNDQVL